MCANQQQVSVGGAAPAHFQGGRSAESPQSAIGRHDIVVLAKREIAHNRTVRNKSRSRTRCAINQGRLTHRYPAPQEFRRASRVRQPLAPNVGSVGAAPTVGESAPPLKETIIRTPTRHAGWARYLDRTSLARSALAPDGFSLAGGFAERALPCRTFTQSGQVPERRHTESEQDDDDGVVVDLSPERFSAHGPSFSAAPGRWA